MGRIEITTEPHELIIDGTTILMQADPTAGQPWQTLMNASWSFESPKKIENSVKRLTDALAALTHTPEDADTLRKLEIGLPTLKAAVTGYIQAVAGFPTMPSASSNGD